MLSKKCKKYFFPLYFFVFFVSCGELDINLPVEGTYQITALVSSTASSNISLEECALVRAGDTIHPWCENSIASDPDVCGLLVLIRNSRGKTIQAVRYTLRGRSGPSFPAVEFDAQASTVETKNAAESGSTSSEKKQSEYAAVKTLPPAETEVTIDRLTGKLPEFQLPAGMEIGNYTMVSKIFGEQEIIGEVKQNFYYLGNAVFSLSDIQFYLPNAFARSNLVPPETKILMEASVQTDPQFSPYVVWYNGKKIIGKSKVSDGVAFTLWDTPKQGGMQTVRAELFPYQAQTNLKGIIHKIVFPVSAEAPVIKLSPGVPSGIDLIVTRNVRLQDLKLKHWYQFAGTLDDSAEADSEGKPLVSLTENSSRWRASGGSYGLLTGGGDSYFIDSVEFAHSGKSGGAFLFRVDPLSHGVLLNAIFTSTESGETVTMELLYAQRNLVLRLSRGQLSAKEISIPVESVSFPVTAAVVFYFSGNQFEARFAAENIPAAGIDSAVINVSGFPSGQCGVVLGGSTPEKSQTTENAAAIWSQLALFSITPAVSAKTENSARRSAARTGLSNNTVETSMDNKQEYAELQARSVENYTFLSGGNENF